MEGSKWEERAIDTFLEHKMMPKFSRNQVKYRTFINYLGIWSKVRLSCFQKAASHQNFDHILDSTK